VLAVLAHADRCCPGEFPITDEDAYTEDLQHSTGLQVSSMLYSTDVGWPELCICTIYDRIFGEIPAKNVYLRIN
jgi:hypothetical protein